MELEQTGRLALVLDAAGQPDNDATLELYRRIAVAQADAGADVVAPSGMMDGQVGAIRGALDDAGHEQIPILAYSAKYATALYGPFRDAVDVTIEGGGNRKGYQQDVANTREAMEEIREDVGEGADMVMIKPAMPYLDLIARARQELDIPIALCDRDVRVTLRRAWGALPWYRKLWLGSSMAASAFETPELSEEELGFESTADVEPQKGIIGQADALESLRFGLELFAPGQNVFVRGLSGTGRTSLVRRVLEEIARCCCA